MFSNHVLGRKRSVLAWAATLAAPLLAALSQPAMAVDPTTQVQYLSGTDAFNTVNWNFSLSSGRGSGVQTTIAVPGTIELKGFGAYAYNADYTNTGTGQYSYSFNVSPDWTGKRIYIVFDAAAKDATVLINGLQAGPTHQGSYYRFKYDITSLVHVGGTNTLQVNVTPNDPQLVCEYGDYWSYWGIYRPVYLQAFPSQFVERVAVNARGDGTFAMDTYLNGVTSATGVSAQIEKLDGTPVGAPFSLPVASGDTHKLLTTTIQNALAWNTETPNMYQVAVTLLNGSTSIHTMTQKFAFRTVEVRPNDGLYVNGTKVRLKGFDRHVFWPTVGRAGAREVEAVDMAAFSFMNANAVRSSHYPPDEAWLDLADQQGLYVMDELSSYQKPTQVLPTTLGHQLIEDMVTTTVNHPSIVFWDNGNEGGWNTALDGDFALWDPQNRQVIHPGTNGNFNNITSYHYPTYAFANTPGTALHLYDEFDHAIGDGGGGASLNDFWTAMVNRQGTIGGMIWAFLDEDILRTDHNPMNLDGGSSNNDGILGPYREREGSVNTIREIWSPIYIEMNNYATYPAGFDGTLVINNRYDFTNSSQVTFKWQLVNYTTLGSLVPGHTVAKAGVAPSPSIPPRSTGTLSLQLPADWANYDALLVTATDANGKDLYTWSFGNKKAAGYVAQNVSPSGPSPATGTVSSSTITASANGTTVQFSATTGKIASVAVNGKPMSLAGGTLTALDNTSNAVERATTVVQSVSGVQSGNNYQVNVAFGPTSSLKSMTWTMLPSGWLQLDYQYVPPTTTANYKLYGMTFVYPEANLLGMRYLGKGPNRVWKNRMKGTTLDVWSKEYDTTERGQNVLADVTGYTKAPTEFRGDYSNLLWTDVSTSEGSIWMVSGNDNTFLQVAPKPSNFYTSGDVTSPGFASGTFSFLDAVPPIADKFQVPPNIGPESAWNAPAGATFTKTVYFKFDPTEAPGLVPAPVVNAGPDANVVEGTPFTSSGSFADVGATGSWTGVVNYGDGHGLRPLPFNGMNFTLNNVYPNVGVYTVVATVMDNAGHVGTDTASVTVGYPSSGIPGDVNGDGVVNCQDLTAASAAVGKRTGQPGFLPTADFDNNGVIDIRDIAGISRLLPAGTHC